MLSCKEVVKRSSDYVDGNLGFWGRVSYKFHLFMCVHCRRYIRHFTLAIGVSRECAESHLPEEQASAISKRARDQVR
ncbi:zf-HC2 domain-containing protein [Simiduia agarivorans]|uniref:Putative zinc-finger domain-containing protein n=1 Tax=Simiduia agarivorans (strain DSM 21679 / JCM 13881 / BCRC 17597 / SA1) TaxID=1117647 RepID=K4KZE9_SIMAS|nr:zf-HC2 domain-containing protein [Simiduia agarivorans]AFU99297.1 hypothetical protein M5M_10590 [Simiduia agarivorans SA1 = DSM 21679]